MRALAMVLAISALVACGDDDDDDDDELAIDAAAAAPDSAAGTPDAPPSGVDASGMDAAATDGGTDGLTVSFTSVVGLGDCMPIVPPDPMGVTFMVTYDNTGGGSAAKAILTEVELTWDDGDGMVATQKINVAPGVVAIPAGGTMMVTHNKTTSIDDLAMDCSYCGGTVKVGLGLTIDGGDLRVFTSEAGDVECAF